MSTMKTVKSLLSIKPCCQKRRICIKTVKKGKCEMLRIFGTSIVHSTSYCLLDKKDNHYKYDTTKRIFYL